MKPYLPHHWYQKMQKIIKDNKNIEPNYATPNGCILGILENNKEIQVIIIKLLDEIDSQNH